MAFIRVIYKFIKQMFCCCCTKKDEKPLMNQYFYEDDVQTNYVVCDVWIKLCNQLNLILQHSTLN
jgi:hypothetical protein